MGVIYGTSTAFEAVRTAVVAQIGALITAMAADDPKISYSYSTHWADPALAFNSVSVGIKEVEMTYPAQYSAGAGPVIDFHFQIDLRVMIGFANAYHDEVKVARLLNSLVNWFEAHRTISADPKILLLGFERADPHVAFEDTDTIGGLLTFSVRTVEGYTAA